MKDRRYYVSRGGSGQEAREQKLRLLIDNGHERVMIYEFVLSESPHLNRVNIYTHWHVTQDRRAGGNPSLCDKRTS